MKKAVWWLAVLTVMMTGTVTANDLYIYIVMLIRTVRLSILRMRDIRKWET